MTNFEILRSSVCTTPISASHHLVVFRLKTKADSFAGFDALIALMTAELKRIDTNIDKTEGIGGENVNAVHDHGLTG